MSHPPESVLAIACLTDSSLAIATEWFHILSDYLAPLFNRLAEAHPQPLNQCRLAFITYGLASTRPTPLLCERFFQIPDQIQRELREEPAKFGIGHTTVGANSGGMAALEGLVSALEMFDKLRNSIGLDPSINSQPQSLQNKRPNIVSHIIHFAAGPPDASAHPLWNTDPNFDEIGWKNIPVEFKKREINYSMILVRKLPQFMEIHSLMSASESNVTPWFNVAPQHSILLSGFPSKGVKRPTTSDISSPDQKRPRQNSTSKSSPSVPNNSSTDAVNPPNPTADSNSASATIPAPAAAVPTSVPATQPLARPPLPFASLPPERKQQVLEQYGRIQNEIRQEAEAIRTASQDGKPQDVIAQMRSEFTRKYQMLRRLNELIGDSQSAKNPDPGLPPSTSALQVQSGNPVLSGAGPGQLTATLNHATISGNNAPPNPTSEPSGVANTAVPNEQSYPPEMAARINKLIEQQHQSRQTDIPAPKQHQLPQAAKWQGTFSWAGTDSVTRGRREIKAAVAGQCSLAASDPQVHTWPKDLHLMPSQDKMVPPPDFQNWVKTHKPALCQFTPIAVPGMDSKMNEMNCKQLMQLLSEKNFYAVAAWDLPNGTKNSNNLLLLPFKGNGLVGAVFPSTGIPEMPKSTAPVEAFPPQDTSQFIAQFNNLPPERQQMMKSWIISKQQQQQRNMASSSSSGDLTGPDAGGPPGNAQFQMRMNLPPYGGGGGGPAMGGTGMSGNMPTGGVPGVSMEMMQSFMQRKMDGGGQLPNGMN